MIRRRFGPLDRDVAIIGQGSWYLDSGNRTDAISALRHGIDLGSNHIDTAEMYGEAEPLIAEAIAGRREDVFLVSKVLPSNASRQGVVAACERTLARLRTDRLDCYLLHWRGGIPLAETFAGFEALERAGKILSWGVSNFDVADLEEALSVAGEGRFACNQVLYHLGERAIEHGVLPWCEAHGVAVVAYSPFGHDRFVRDGTPGGRVLAEIGTKHGVTPRQAALAFLTHRRSIFAIPKASTPEHAAQNAAAMTVELDETDMDRIDSMFPRGPRKTHLPML